MTCADTINLVIAIFTSIGVIGSIWFSIISLKEVNRQRVFEYDLRLLVAMQEKSEKLRVQVFKLISLLLEIQETFDNSNTKDEIGDRLEIMKKETLDLEVYIKTIVMLQYSSTIKSSFENLRQEFIQHIGLVKNGFKDKFKFGFAFAGADTDTNTNTNTSKITSTDKTNQSIKDSTLKVVDLADKFDKLLESYLIEEQKRFDSKHHVKFRME